MTVIREPGGGDTGQELNDDDSAKDHIILPKLTKTVHSEPNADVLKIDLPSDSTSGNETPTSLQTLESEIGRKPCSTTAPFAPESQLELRQASVGSNPGHSGLQAVGCGRRLGEWLPKQDMLHVGSSNQLNSTGDNWSAAADIDSQSEEINVNRMGNLESEDEGCGGDADDLEGWFEHSLKPNILDQEPCPLPTANCLALFPSPTSDARVGRNPLAISGADTAKTTNILDINHQSLMSMFPPEELSGRSPVEELPDPSPTQSEMKLHISDDSDDSDDNDNYASLEEEAAKGGAGVDDDDEEDDCEDPELRKLACQTSPYTFWPKNDDDYEDEKSAEDSYGEEDEEEEVEVEEANNEENCLSSSTHQLYDYEPDFVSSKNEAGECTPTDLSSYNLCYTDAEADTERKHNDEQTSFINTQDLDTSMSSDFGAFRCGQPNNPFQWPVNESGSGTCATSNLEFHTGLSPGMGEVSDESLQNSGENIGSERSGRCSQCEKEAVEAFFRAQREAATAATTAANLSANMSQRPACFEFLLLIDQLTNGSDSGNILNFSNSSLRSQFVPFGDSGGPRIIELDSDMDEAKAFDAMDEKNATDSGQNANAVTPVVEKCTVEETENCERDEDEEDCKAESEKDRSKDECTENGSSTLLVEHLEATQMLSPGPASSERLRTLAQETNTADTDSSVGKAILDKQELKMQNGKTHIDSIKPLKIPNTESDQHSSGGSGDHKAKAIELHPLGKQESSMQMGKSHAGSKKSVGDPSTEHSKASSADTQPTAAMKSHCSKAPLARVPDNKPKPFVVGTAVSSQPLRQQLKPVVTSKHRATENSTVPRHGQPTAEPLLASTSAAEAGNSAVPVVSATVAAGLSTSLSASDAQDRGQHHLTLLSQDKDEQQHHRRAPAARLGAAGPRRDNLPAVRTTVSDNSGLRQRANHDPGRQQLRRASFPGGLDTGFVKHRSDYPCPPESADAATAENPQHPPSQSRHPVGLSDGTRLPRIHGTSSTSVRIGRIVPPPVSEMRLRAPPRLLVPLPPPAPPRRRPHPLAARRPYTPPNRNVLASRAVWPSIASGRPVPSGAPHRSGIRCFPAGSIGRLMTTANWN